MKYIDLIKGIFIISVVAWLFYDSVIVMFIAAPFGYIFYIKGKGKRNLKQTRTIRKQFADAMASCAMAMDAGYSIENSFYESYKDMFTMYGKDAPIVKDLEIINNKLKVRCSLEQIFEWYADFRNIEEIKYFSDVLSISRKAGGNIVQIMKGTKDMIYEKEDIQRQVDISISSKKYECVIMELMPLGVIAYFKMFSPEFICAMYDGIMGGLIMTILLAIYIAMVYVAQKMCVINI